MTTPAADRGAVGAPVAPRCSPPGTRCDPVFDAFLAPVVVTMSLTRRGEPPLGVVTRRLFAEFDSRRRLGEIDQRGIRASAR